MSSLPTDPPPLSNALIELVPVTSESYNWIYRAAVSSESGWRWRLRGATPSPERFAQILWADILAQFVMVRRSDRKPVGLVQGYRADHMGRHCYIAVLLAEPMLNQGWPLDGIGLFMDYLFRNWDFHKLYAEANSFNVPQFRSLGEHMFRQEGHLREHSRQGHLSSDLYIYALYRTDWEDSGACGRIRGEVRAPKTTVRPLALVLQDEFGIDPTTVTASTRLSDDLGLDSIDVLELSVILEDRLPANYADYEWGTIGDIEALLLGLAEPNPNEGQRS